jgi:hypothetical protein
MATWRYWRTAMFGVAVGVFAWRLGAFPGWAILAGLFAGALMTAAAAALPQDGWRATALGAGFVLALTAGAVWLAVWL